MKSKTALDSVIAVLSDLCSTGDVLTLKCKTERIFRSDKRDLLVSSFITLYKISCQRPGVIFDSNLTLDKHINTRIRSILDIEETRLLQ